MQQLESFTVIAKAIGRPRKVTYDSLAGLRIEGVNVSEAHAIVHALENLTQENLVALAKGEKLDAIAPNQARWGPKTAPKPRPTATPVADMPRTVPHVPDTPPNAPVEPPETVAAPVVPPEPENASDAVSDGRADPAEDTAAECASEAPAPVATVFGPGEAADVEDWGDAPESAPVMVAHDATDDEVAAALIENTERNATAAEDPRPTERRAPPKPARNWRVGDHHEGAEVVKVNEHKDGSCLVIRADGWRVKFSKAGKEEARLEGEPLEAIPVEAAQPDPEPPADSGNAQDRQAYPVPQTILDTRTARDVVKHLIDHGVTHTDTIVAECVKLKERGAKAFEASKNEEGVRRRVMSSLTVLGHQ